MEMQQVNKSKALEEFNDCFVNKVFKVKRIIVFK